MLSEKKPVVEVKNLNKTFGKNKVLDNISFHINANEIVGFIGPNGAGKSTTMKCLCNLIYPDSGSITIGGCDLFKQHKKAVSQLSALIESPGLFLDLTGKENVKMIARLRGVSRARVKEILDFTEIGKPLDRSVKGYSMGMKQRLALGIAIMTKPRFLILDEPTNGLDPTGVVHLRNTIEHLMKTEDISILFSSHQLGEVEKLADRIICINNGKIIETPKVLEDTFGYLLRFNDMENAYKVISSIVPESLISKIDVDTFRVDFTNTTSLNQTLRCLTEADIMLADIQKDLIDIEAVYKSIYGAANA